MKHKQIILEKRCKNWNVIHCPNETFLVLTTKSTDENITPRIIQV